MRTLKKALSLVLVLAMVFALAVPGFAVDKSSEYTDYADVKNTEAVDVLTALDVLNGNDDGSFGPEGSFTRAQAAVMVAKMMMGANAKALTNTATQFNDVPATHWASGYIQYCASMGIIKGDGVNFMPDQSLTAAQWALMLLGVLGYNAANEGIGGMGYEIATTALAIKAKVASADEMTAPFNRDMAAKLALNALKADCVEYVGGTNITIGDTTITQGATRQPMYVTRGTAGANSIGKNENYNIPAVDANARILQLGEKLYEGDLALATGGADGAGHPAYTWTYTGIRTTANAAGVVGQYAATPAYTIVIDPLHQTNGAGGGGAPYYATNNTALLAALKTATGANFLTIADSDSDTSIDDETILCVNGKNAAVFTNNLDVKTGDIIEVFVDPTNTDVITKVVVSHYTYDFISNVNTNVSDTDKKNGITVRVTTNGGKTITNKTVGYDADTFVKYAKLALLVDTDDATTVQNAYVLTKVSGAMSAYTGASFVTNATTGFSSITVGGTKYAVAGGVNYDATMPTSFKTTDSYDLFLDANGYVLYAQDTNIKTDLANVRYINGAYVEASTVYGVPGYNIYVQTVALDGTVGRELIGTLSYFGTGASNTIAGADPATYYYSVSGNVLTGVLGNGTLTTGTDFYTLDTAKTGITTTWNLANEKNALVTFAPVATKSYVKAVAYNDNNVTAYDGATTLTAKTTKLADSSSYITADTKFVLVEKTLGAVKTKVYTGPIALVAGNQTNGQVIYTLDANGNKVADYIVIRTTDNTLTNDTTSKTVYYLASTTTAKTTLGIDGKTNVTSYTMYDVKGNPVEVTVANPNSAVLANGTTGQAFADNTFYCVESLATDTGINTLKVVAELTSTSAFDPLDLTEQKTALYAVTYDGDRYGDKISGTNTGVDTFVASDINAANAVVIDLRSATDKAADCFGADITSLDLLQSAGLVAKANGGQKVSFDAYATMADGYTVIFVTGIA